MPNDILLVVRIIYSRSKALYIDDHPTRLVGIVRDDLSDLRLPQPPRDSIKIVGRGRVEFSWSAEEGGILHRALEKRINPASRFAVTKKQSDLLYKLSIVDFEYEKEFERPRRQWFASNQSPNKRSSMTYHPNKSWVRDRNASSQSFPSRRDFHAEAEDLLEEVKREFGEPDLSSFSSSAAFPADYERSNVKDSPSPVFMTKVEEETPSLHRGWDFLYHDGPREPTPILSDYMDTCTQKNSPIPDIPGLDAHTRTPPHAPLTANTSLTSTIVENSFPGDATIIDVDADVQPKVEPDTQAHELGSGFQRAPSSMSIASSSGWKISTPPPSSEALEASAEEPTIVQEDSADGMLVIRDMDIEMTSVQETPHSNSPPPFRPPQSNKSTIPPQPTPPPPPLPSHPPSAPPSLRINTGFVPVTSPNASPDLSTASSSSNNTSKPRFKIAFPFKTRAKPASQGSGQPSPIHGFQPTTQSRETPPASAKSDGERAPPNGREQEREQQSVVRLTQELEEVRKELREGMEREKRILNELKGLGADDEVMKVMAGVAGTDVSVGVGGVGPASAGEIGSESENEDMSLYAMRKRLRTVEEEIETERKKRKEMEEILKEVERECREPFVVPALLQAFVTVSQMTTKVCEGVPK